MASFEDYDEFGNYIGADLDSDDEDDVPQNQFLREQASGSAAPLEGYEDEPMRDAEEDAAMDVDGTHCNGSSTFNLFMMCKRRTTNAQRGYSP